MALILGLDLRHDVVRGALARVTSRGAEIVRYVDQSVLPTTTPEARAVAVVDAITALTATLGAPPDRIVTRLSGLEASIRTVTLPRAALRRAHEVLPFELDAALPYDAKDAIIDYQVIDEKGAEVPLLVASAPRERVEAHLRLMSTAGISPREIGVGAAALDGLDSVVPELAGENLVMIIDSGRDQTDVVALKHGICVFARSLSTAMEGARSGRLESELKQTLAALRAGGIGEVSTVYLAGDAGTDGHAPGWFSEKLGIPAKPLELPDAPGASSENRVQFAAALALACRAASRRKRLNLRRGDLVETNSGGGIRKYARSLAIGAACVLLAFAFSVTAKWMGLKDENELLTAQLEKVTERAFGKGTKDVSEAEMLVEGKGPSGNPLPAKDAYDILEAISSRIPTDIVHDVRKLVVELEDDGQTGRFELRGSVASIAERDRIATALGEYECFRELEKGTTTPAPGGKGIAYPLEGKVRCPGVRDPKAPRAAASTNTGADQ